MSRKLRVEFPTEEAFRREYVDNISNGGTFVPTRKTFAPRELVTVELVLRAAGETVELPGEVVHCVPQELAATGASAGVAVEFALPTEELRARLAPFAPTGIAMPGEREFGAGRRAAPRSRARTGAQIRVDGRWLDGRTRNISSSGVLVAVPGDPVPIGTEVLFCLAHPTTEEELEITGVVRRQLETAGEACLGIEFRIPETRRLEFERFLIKLRTFEHNRHLGGISGPIADLGIERLVRMFGASAPRGTLTLSRDDEEGFIAIENGVLHARLGRHHGRAALEALLGWRHGHFEFEARSEPGPASGGVALADLFGDEAVAADTELPGGSDAVWDAVAGSDDDSAPSLELELVDVVDRSVVPGERSAPPDPADFDPADFDEDADPWDDAAALSASRLAVDTAPIPGAAKLSLADATCRERLDEFSKTEQALLDLAGVGVTVGKAVDIIPEPAPDVYAALSGLIAAHIITLQ